MLVDPNSLNFYLLARRPKVATPDSFQPAAVRTGGSLSLRAPSLPGTRRQSKRPCADDAGIGEGDGSALEIAGGEFALARGGSCVIAFVRRQSELLLAELPASHWALERPHPHSAVPILHG
jgi:hypothetical protein